MRCTRCRSEYIFDTIYSICASSTRWIWMTGADGTIREERVSFHDYEIWPISLCIQCIRSSFIDYLKAVRIRRIKYFFAVVLFLIFLILFLWMFYKTYIRISDNKMFIIPMIVMIFGVLVSLSLMILFIRILSKLTQHYKNEKSKICNGEILSDMGLKTIIEAGYAESMAIIENKKRGIALENHFNYPFPTSFKKYGELPEDVRRVFPKGHPDYSKRKWEVVAVAESLEKLHQVVVNKQASGLLEVPETLLALGFVWSEEFEAKWQEKVTELHIN